MSTDQTKIFQFAEFADELILLSEKNDYKEIACMAFGADAQAAISIKPVTYLNSLQFFGQKGHQALLNKSLLIMRRLRCKWNFTDKNGISDAYERTLMFRVRFYLHYWLMHLYIVARFFESNHPDMVMVPPSTRLDQVGLTIGRNDRLIGTLVRQYLSSHHHLQVEIATSPILLASKKNDNFLSGISSFLGRFVASLLRWGDVRTRRYHPLRVIVAADTYGMTNLLDLLARRRRRLFPVFLRVSKKKLHEHFGNLFAGKEWFLLPLANNAQADPSCELADAINNLVDSIRESPKDVFEFEGVDLREVLVAYLSGAAFSELARLEQSAFDIANMLLGRYPPALVLAQYALGESYALGELCALSGVPAMLISHGTHVCHNERYARLEWQEHARTIIDTAFPYVAVQSPLARSFLDSLNNFKSQLVETGPLLFARRANISEPRDLMRTRLFGEHAERHILLHAGTPKGRGSIRPWVYETVDEYIRNINEVIAETEKIQNAFLAIRFRPSEDLTKESLCRLLRPSHCYTVYDEGSFDEYLLASDVLISYSSTTIEEALQNRVPVLQYDPDEKYAHIDAPTISSASLPVPSAIYYCSRQDLLIPMLDFICAERERLIADSSLWDKYTYPTDEEMSWFDRLMEAPGGC